MEIRGDLLHIKMKSGEEIIADVSQRRHHQKNGPELLFQNPVELMLSGTGITAREWLYFSNQDEAWIPESETLYIHQANQEGYEFFSRIHQARENFGSRVEFDVSPEELMEILSESKDKIKH